MTKVTAAARVTVTLELTQLGSWGEECTLQQIHKQAVEAALEKLGGMNPYNARLIGKPIVNAVITEEIK